MKSSIRTLFFSKASAVILTMFMTCWPVYGADHHWTGGGADANWNTAGNWQVAVPNGSDRVIFDANSTANLNNVNGLGAGTLAGIQIQVLDPAGDVTIGGDSLGLLSGTGIDMSGADRDLTLNVDLIHGGDTGYAVGAGRTLTINGNISGGTGLIKDGDGTLILTGTNTYGGDTEIKGGTLALTSGDGLGGGNVYLKGGNLLAQGTFAISPFELEISTGASGAISAQSGQTLTLNPGIVNFMGNTALSFGTPGNDGVVEYASLGLIAYSPEGTLTVDHGTLRAGNLTLSWLTDWAAATTVNAGATLDQNDQILEIYNLQGAGSVSTGSSADTDLVLKNGNFSGVISGPGEVVIQGGTVVLSGANTYTGGTTVDSGTLMVNGGIPGPVTVNGGGSLGGGGAVGDVTNSGRIAPGASIGTLTVNGDYTHSAGATYTVEVDAAGNGDRIAVTGAATLDGGTVDVQAADGIYKLRTDYTYTILNATGGVTGEFTNVTSNLGFLTAELTHDPTEVILTLTRNALGFTALGGTLNQQGVGAALEAIGVGATGDMEDIIHTLFGLPPAQVRSAFDQMGGGSHNAYSVTELFNAAQYMGLLCGRMGNQRLSFSGGGGSGVGLASVAGPMLAMAGEDTVSDAGPLLAAFGNVMPKQADLRWGAWARGYGVTGERDGDDISSKYDYDIYGTVLGMDGWLTDNILLGVSGGYSYTDVELNQLADTGNVNSLLAALYGSFTHRAWYLDWIASYGWNDYETSRSIVFGGLSRRADADYNGDQISGYMETGYTFHTRVAEIQPLMSGQYTDLSQDGFTETGAGALNLNVAERDTTSILGSLGVHLFREFKARHHFTLTPELRVRWAHEFSNDDHITNAAFAGNPSGSFSVKGDGPERDHGIFGAGITGSDGNGWSFHMQYDVDIAGGNNIAHAVNGGFVYRW